MTHWNYRVLVDQEHLHLIEAYYEGDDEHGYEITAWCNAGSAHGATLEDLEADLDHMREALTTPLLTKRDLP